MMKKRICMKEFELEAVILADASDNHSEVARNLGVSSDCLGNWRKQYSTVGAAPGSGLDVNLSRFRDELKKAQKEVLPLTRVNRIRKTAMGSLSQDRLN